jgi:rod shape-determining protein MreD
MRWLTYFILAYFALGVQVALRGYIDIKGAEPNLILLVVIFVAVNAGREAALGGAFLLGLMQDMLTLQPMGVWAVCYGLVAMFVISTQEVVYREHPLTHFSLALAGGVLCAIVIVIHGWVYPMIHGGGAGALAAAHNPEMVATRRPSIAVLLGGTIYTAILAPFILGALQRMKKGFAFRRRA